MKVWKEKMRFPFIQNRRDAVEFARLTGVDALAVSIGTVHGVYKKHPKMDFERLAKIRSMIEIPLVMQRRVRIVGRRFPCGGQQRDE